MTAEMGFTIQDGRWYSVYSVFTSGLLGEDDHEGLIPQLEERRNAKCQRSMSTSKRLRKGTKEGVYASLLGGKEIDGIA